MARTPRREVGRVGSHSAEVGLRGLTGGGDKKRGRIKVKMRLRRRWDGNGGGRHGVAQASLAQHSQANAQRGTALRCYARYATESVCLIIDSATPAVIGYFEKTAHPRGPRGQRKARGPARPGPASRPGECK